MIINNEMTLANKKIQPKTKRMVAIPVDISRVATHPGKKQKSQMK